MNNQDIIDNAPDDATHIDGEDDFCKDGYYLGYTSRRWIPSDYVVGSRSIADIKRIVELETQQARAEILIHELHEQVYDNRYLDNRVRLYEVLKEQYDK